jgi:hypothetical protein
MDKPTTKHALLASSQRGFDELMGMIEQLSAKDRVKEWKTLERDKNIRDVIYHLYAWHELMRTWLHILLEGGKPELPKRGYTWDDLDMLNHEIWLDAQKHPLMDALELFENSYQTCLEEVQTLSEEQIFTPYFKALNHPIIGLLDGCMSDHYQWALGLIKSHLS